MKALFDKAKEKGFVKTADGYICSKEHLEAEQKEWDESDTHKDFDFSSSEFWLTFDDGREPEPIARF